MHSPREPVPPGGCRWAEIRVASEKDEFWTFSVDSDWLRPVEHAAAGIVAPGDEEVPQINGDE